MEKYVLVAHQKLALIAKATLVELPA